MCVWGGEGGESAVYVPLWLPLPLHACTYTPNFSDVTLDNGRRGPEKRQRRTLKHQVSSLQRLWPFVGVIFTRSSFTGELPAGIYAVNDFCSASNT